MIDIRNNELNLNKCLNSIVICRDLQGNSRQLRIFAQSGPIVKFKDEKNNQYELPPFINLNLLPKSAKVSAGAKKVSLQFCYDEFENEEFVVEDYSGAAIKLKIDKIEEKTYGWSAELNFPYQEKNLIIDPVPVATPKIQPPLLKEK